MLPVAVHRHYGSRITYIVCVMQNMTCALLGHMVNPYSQYNRPARTSSRATKPFHDKLYLIVVVVVCRRPG